jgi:hypothetical protein
MIPFHFKSKDNDFLGVIRLTKSRRDKTKCRAHVSIGSDWEYVAEVECGDTWGDIDQAWFFAAWAYSYGHMDDWFGIDNYELPNKEMNIEEFNAIIAPYGAKLRVW